MAGEAVYLSDVGPDLLPGIRASRQTPRVTVTMKKTRFGAGLVQVRRAYYHAGGL